MLPGWLRFVKTFCLLGIGAVAGVIFGINIYLQVWVPPSSWSYYSDWDSPPWPFTWLRWNIAVAGLTISVFPILIISECFRRKPSPMIAVELFWLIALSVVWIITTVLDVRMINQYKDYCFENGEIYWDSDICNNIIPLSKTSRTLDIVATILTCLYTAFVLITYLIIYMRNRHAAEPAQATDGSPSLTNVKA